MKSLAGSPGRRSDAADGRGRSPPRVIRFASALYLGTAFLVVAWAVGRLLGQPTGHPWWFYDEGRKPVEGAMLVATFFAPLFAYLVSLGFLIRRARYEASHRFSPVVPVGAIVVHPLVLSLVTAAFARLSLFASKGDTWSGVGSLSGILLGIGVFFGPVPALLQLEQARRMKAFLLVSVLGSAWILFLLWLSYDHILDLVPPSR